MAGYSGTPLWKKLGYKTGMSAYVEGGPKNYRSLLALPADVEVRWLTRPGSDIEFIHLFAISASELKAKLKSYRTKIVSDGVIWVSWPKKSSGVKTDITKTRFATWRCRWDLSISKYAPWMKFGRD